MGCVRLSRAQVSGEEATLKLSQHLASPSLPFSYPANNYSTKHMLKEF